MKETTAQVDVITELKAIISGSCAWCENDLPHPVYSQCPNREIELQHVLVHVPVLEHLPHILTRNL